MIYVDKHDFYLGPEPSDSDSDSEESESQHSVAQGSDLNSTRSSLVSSANEKAGWLQKQSDNILKTWSWRFFTLKNCKLSYFKSPDDKTPSGTINFNQVSAKLAVRNPSRPTALSISIQGLTYSLNLKSPSSNEIKDWISHLQSHIDASQGKVKELSLVHLGEKLWKHERISEYFFRTNASTGDLILFRSKDLGSKIQRGITGSKYDHIAMVLCYSSGRLGILEATQSEGVSIIEWEEFMANGWHLMAERMVYRKLEYERTDECLIKLDEFTKKVNGKAYRLSPKKIFWKVKKSEPGEEEDFFCSELVASAYKAMGILPEFVAASGFLPGSFADDKKLVLIGASLGHEMVIDFDL